MVQSEAMLENELIERLKKNGYEFVKIVDEEGLKRNFKKQLENFNNIKLTDEEFGRIMAHMDKGNVFRKAQILRDKYELEREDGTIYISFIDGKDFSKNIFQVSNQIQMEDKYKNRYDVTLLINGIPLVQIELKKRGIELKQAFNQIKRYHKHSFKGLFNYIQIFVISNYVSTKYYANNRDISYKFAFCWTDKENKKITNIERFADTFLEHSHLIKMITEYIVLYRTQECLMILRPYQYYAVEAIMDRVLNTKENGFIWHTTGSGKTLTSFKVSELLSKREEIDKVIFVVDRKDLDNQTTKEFNSFCEGAVDRTDNTESFVKQFTGKNKFIITTIQKFNRAISNDRYEHRLEKMKDKKIILIFDECHRSNFGDMHKNITGYFSNIQYFGFTGTPIFSKNANSYRTTKDIFGECLHKYSIKNAISDENVLGFLVEYLGDYKDKNQNKVDIDVEGIDVKGYMESEKRLNEIVDYIINYHSVKTFNKTYTAIFAVSSIKVLTKYYEIFKSKEHDLKIATIFSYVDNEEDDGSDEHSKDKLERYMKDYNEMFGTNYTADTFNNYNVDVAKRVKNREIDILLVVNMFLTGFDSKYLNTLYVDKNLQYHGLLQAFSRTNRVLDERKKHGNILCFRNLKNNVDEAISMYSGENDVDVVLMKPYQEYVDKFNELLENGYQDKYAIEEIDSLESEASKEEFVKWYRGLLRIMTRLKVYTEFEFEDLNISEQKYLDYQSKYYDLYQSVKKGGNEKVSILEDIDFEVELLRTDRVNVDYILDLIKKLNVNSKTFQRDRKEILETLDKKVELKSKKQLIQKFIDNNLKNIVDKDKFDEEFDNYLEKEKAIVIDTLIKEEDLKRDEINRLIHEYQFSGKFEDKILENIFNREYGIIERGKKELFIKETIENITELFRF